jgi:hypothetical protein
MRFALPVLAFSTLLLSGCLPLGGSSTDSHTGSSVSTGVLGQMRPKIDPRYLEKARQEDLSKLQQQYAQSEGVSATPSTDANNGFARLLPQVSMDPISGQASALSGTLMPGQSESGISTGDAATAQGLNVSGAAPTLVAEVPRTAEVATYSGAYASNTVPPPPPGSLSGGSMAPPPPAVTLSTQAQMGDPGAAMYANPYANPYMNPYANPYLNPYAAPYQPQPYPAQMPIPQQPERPAGLFGSGGARPRHEDDGERKKVSNFVPITPTGMEARSPYKQRDDLKVLWKGALAGQGMQRLIGRDVKAQDSLTRLEVGLPTDNSKGSFSISQRQVDGIFKPVFLDKKVAPAVRRTQSDLAQAYYRYLYTYNKFALAQQTLAARKQEVEVASTDVEKQRSAADLAHSQNEAESARDDMKAAQMELSAVAGSNAARSVIARVSGVSPSVEVLAQAEAQPAAENKNNGGFSFNLGGLFGLNNQKKAEDEQLTASAARALVTTSPSSPAKVGKVGKTTSKNEGKNSKAHLAVKNESPAAGDLSPAPAATAKAEAPEASNGLALELKGVSVTARKSILTVAIRNNTGSDFSFNPDSFCVMENNQKLSEAAMRAEFETTLVQPNQEVKGTITIFGRPWNDKLTVSLSEGGKNLNLRR